MPYDINAHLGVPNPVGNYLQARDAAQNALMQQQQLSDAEAARQAQADRQAAQDQAAANALAARQEQDSALKAHTAFQYLANVADKPDVFARTAQGIYSHPEIGSFLQRNGVTLDDITPQNVQELLAETGSITGQAPPAPVTPKYGQPVAGVGPDGKPVYQRFSAESPNGVAVENFRPAPPASSVDKPLPGMTPSGKLDSRFEGQVRAILSYRAPPLPQGRAGPNQAIMAEVYNRDPTYDAPNYGAKSATIRSFMAGADGKQVDAVNTAVQHLEQLKGLAEALNSGDNQLINRAKQAYARATGKAAPSNFDTVANVAAAEVNKVATGGPGASEDRELSRAALQLKMSPAQIAEGIDNLQGLMAGRLNSVALRYKNGTKLDNFNSLLLPETLDALDRHGYGQTGASSQPQQLPARNAQGWVLHTDANNNKAYVSPDGKQYQEVP